MSNAPEQSNTTWAFRVSLKLSLLQRDLKLTTSALWIHTSRLLQEDEVAEKHAKEGRPPIPILIAG